jgi:hypothetical protein
MSATIPRLAAAAAAAVARDFPAALDGARHAETALTPSSMRPVLDRVVVAGISGEPEQLAGKQPWAAT